MIRRFLSFLENIFLIPEDKKGFNKIFLDKTTYYNEKFEIFSLDKVYVACEYEQNLQKALKKFKYEYNEKSLEDIIIHYEELIDIFVLDKYESKDMIITWIPIFALNRLIRWFNQTYLIWRYLSKRFNYPFLEILKKNKYTKKQAWLSRVHRLENLKDCFKINSSYNDIIIWKTILIIDDVISTWTTVNEVAKILKAAWAKEIIGLFLATWK